MSESARFGQFSHGSGSFDKHQFDLISGIASHIAARINQPAQQMQAGATEAIRARRRNWGLQRIEGRRSITVSQPALSVAAGNRQSHQGVALATKSMVDGVGKQFLDGQLHAQLAFGAHAGSLCPPAELCKQLWQGGEARRHGNFVDGIEHEDQRGGTTVIKAYWIAAVLLASLNGHVWAQGTQTAGMVKHVRGTVHIERGNEQLPATVGAPLQVADKVRTGADGAVGLTLRDHTLLSAGPNSLLSINQFSFDSTTHDGKLSVGVRKGTVSVTTGKIARKTPESVEFHTPTSMLGARGTEFVIEVAGGWGD